MRENYIDVAYLSRIDRSQVLVNQWAKVFPENFKDLSICQQRNLAIIK